MKTKLILQGTKVLGKKFSSAIDGYEIIAAVGSVDYTGNARRYKDVLDIYRNERDVPPGTVYIAVGNEDELGVASRFIADRNGYLVAVGNVSEAMRNLINADSERNRTAYAIFEDADIDDILEAVNYFFSNFGK